MQYPYPTYKTKLDIIIRQISQNSYIHLKLVQTVQTVQTNGSRFVANSNLSYRAITGGNLTRGSKSRERLPLGYTYGRTVKGIAPMERSLTKKQKNTLPSHTSSVDDSPSPCLSFFSPNYKCWVVLTFFVRIVGSGFWGRF